MNEKDAQFILESYRPGTDDDSDPLFREALEVAQNHPELLEWLHKNQAMDTMFSQALNEITPPEDLRLSIFTAAATRQEAAPHTQHPSWWRSPWTLSVAASFAVMLLVAVSIIEPREAEADWNVSRILESASKQPAPSTEQVSIDTLSARLDQGDFPQLQTPFQSNQGITTTKGHALLDWDGLLVERWSFTNEAGEIFQLYLIDGKDLSPEPSIKKPIFKQLGNTALAAWTANNTLYVLAKEGTIESLKPILKDVGTTPPSNN